MTKRNDYEEQKTRARERQRAMSLEGRDIGTPKPPVDPARREACRFNFRLFCETYLPQTFNLPWSEDHLRVIKKLETAVLHGGLFAIAMPRGSGKTSLCEAACLWALLFGHHRFVVLIGADEGAAELMLDSLRSEIENNDILDEDFNEVTLPVRALEGIHQRAKGQLSGGHPTLIRWTGKTLVLPSIKSSESSGAVIRTAGITGQVRGAKYKCVNGETIRPTLVLIDDPQTNESAKSPSQCDERELIIAGAILGLAGPGKKISGLMPCTVIREDDLADRLLNRERYPQWNGERTRMVHEWPTSKALWEEYCEIWHRGMQSQNNFVEATEFYRQNREAMDAGAKVAWPERFNDDELSALQHAYNLRLTRKDRAFYAEYQNDPLSDIPGTAEMLTADQIAEKLSSVPRGTVPLSTAHLTAFIDVQGAALFYTVCAWSDQFTGYVIGYGTEPEQRTNYFTLRDLAHTLQDTSPQAGLEGAIYAGLESLTDRILGREWAREDGAQIRIERCLIDANWGQSTEVVYQFCRQSRYASSLMPSHGVYVGASSIPFSSYKRKQGERLGFNWRIPAVKGSRAIRHVVFDTNAWKSFVHARLMVALGDSGCLSLFGRSADAHRLFADHLTSEYPVRTEGRGRVVDEWKLRASGRDNHYLDCLVGAAVAASMQGASLTGMVAPSLKRRPRQRLSDLQRRVRR